MCAYFTIFQAVVGTPLLSSLHSQTGLLWLLFPFKVSLDVCFNLLLSILRCWGWRKPFLECQVFIHAPPFPASRTFLFSENIKAYLSGGKRWLKSCQSGSWKPLSCLFILCGIVTVTSLDPAGIWAKMQPPWGPESCGLWDDVLSTP